MGARRAVFGFLVIASAIPLPSFAQSDDQGTEPQPDSVAQGAMPRPEDVGAAQAKTTDDGQNALAEGAGERPVETTDPHATTPAEEAGDVDEWGDSDEWEDFDEDWGGEAEQSGDKALSFELHGFVEALIGARVVSAPSMDNELTAAEARFRLNLDASHDVVSARFRGDFVADALFENIVLVDVRDASVFARGGGWFSTRVGIQVLTWGTGDFVFLNDLFPKDFVSFFIGRADEYLKAPSLSAVVTFTIEKVGLDLVWTPIFTPDRFISGERLAFFDPITGEVIGDRSEFVPIDPVLPSKRLRNSTGAARLYGTVKAYELAAYGYIGFWNQPNAFDIAALRLTYARLAVYGASARGPLLGGVFNVETAFYQSFEDDEGVDPEIPNSQLRWLVGYEREVIPKFQLGLQYYVEYTLHHDELIANSFWPEFEQQEFRHVVTVRLTQLLLLDTLELSLFAFFSPNELDTYIRPRITYAWTEALTVSVGANLLFGRDDFTFLGQLEQNSNVYARFRYSF